MITKNSLLRRRTNFCRAKISSTTEEEFSRKILLSQQGTKNFWVSWRIQLTIAIIINFVWWCVWWYQTWHNVRRTEAGESRLPKEDVGAAHCWRTVCHRKPLANAKIISIYKVFAMVFRPRNGNQWTRYFQRHQLSWNTSSEKILSDELQPRWIVRNKKTSK